MKHELPTKKKRTAFTLVELLVATAVLMIIMAVLLQLTGTMGDIWRRATGRIGAFQQARAAFETVTSQLSQATLNTYFDYVDDKGRYRAYSYDSDFIPSSFKRTSELHFLCGSTLDLVENASAIHNPGGAVFFQAPLGITRDPALRPLNRTLNSIGFYVQWRSAAQTGLMPKWLEEMFDFGDRSSYQLLQFIQPAEENSVYNSTMQHDENFAPYIFQRREYDDTWLEDFVPDSETIRPAVLAENVLLFVVLPRLAPEDEKVMMGAATFDSADFPAGTGLCPAYAYDSRAWIFDNDNPQGQIPPHITSILQPFQGRPTITRAAYMRNQLPPIVDVVMIVADANSLRRFDMTQPEPPEILRPPNPQAFRRSAELESDITAFENKLIANQIKFRTFRTAVLIRGAKWSNDL